MNETQLQELLKHVDTLEQMCKSYRNALHLSSMFWKGVDFYFGKDVPYSIKEGESMSISVRDAALDMDHFYVINQIRHELIDMRNE